MVNSLLLCSFTHSVNEICGNSISPVLFMYLQDIYIPVQGFQQWQLFPIDRNQSDEPLVIKRHDGKSICEMHVPCSSFAPFPFDTVFHRFVSIRVNNG